jgi:hypothetical protein
LAEIAAFAFGVTEPNSGTFIEGPAKRLLKTTAPIPIFVKIDAVHLPIDSLYLMLYHEGRTKEMPALVKKWR